MKKSRNQFLDILKGIAIILVIIGHCIQFGSGENFLKKEVFFDNFVFKLIYSFHMPLFMLISGYLFYFSIKKYTTKEIIINRLKTLVIPIFTYSIIMLIIELAKGNKLNFINAFINNLWFLWAIFYCSIIVLIVNKISKDNLFVYFTIFIISFITPETHGIALYKFMYPFFISGYLFNKFYKKEKLKYNINFKIITYIIGVIFIILLISYNKKVYIYLTGYYILKDKILLQLLIDIYRMCIGFIGSIFVIMIIKKIVQVKEMKYICNALAYIGKKSLGIYIISNLIFAYVLPNITSSMQNINYLYMFIETIIVTIISTVITIGIQKNKFTNMIFLGNRQN